MRTSIASVATVAALFAGSATGAAVLADTVATAQEADPGPGPEAPEPGAWVREALDGLVEDGVITPEQADAVFDALKEARPDRPRRGRLHGMVRAAAEVIGIEPSELGEALREGRSIAEVAEENGVDPAVVVVDLVAGAQERLDRAVEEGKITEEEAAQRAEDLAERVEAFVNGEMPPPPPGRGPRPERGGAPTDDAATEAETTAT